MFKMDSCLRRNDRPPNKSFDFAQDRFGAKQVDYDTKYVLKLPVFCGAK